ncbi:ABC transporter permease subunit, partial [Streptomyces rubiginosohelvolus]
MSTATQKTESPAPPPAEGSPSVGTLLLQGLRSNMRQYGMLVALALIIVIFQIWSDDILLRPLNVTNLVQQNGYILILAIGMMIVIIAGHIDLSVGSLVAFIGAAAGVMMIKHDMPWPLAVVLCLLLGAVAGAWQGFWIAYIGIPSFIVTLAGMLAFRGGTQILLDGQSLSPFPDGFEKMSTGFIPEMGPYTQYHNPTMVIGLVVCAAAVWQEWRARQQRTAYELDVVPLGLFFVKCAAIVAAVMAFTMTLSSWHGAPYGLLILAVLFVVFSFVMRNTVVGRHVYA